MPTCHPIDTCVASDWRLVGRPTLVGRGVFVQRSAMAGRPWLRLLWRYELGRWDVSAYKTRREAVDGPFGGGKGRAFQFGGPNVWGA